MENIYKYIVLFVLSCSGLSHANNTDLINKFTNSTEEQTHVYQWIKNNSRTDLSSQELKSTIAHIFAVSYSKDIDPYLVLGMITQESRYRKTARSSYGAKGLMQVVPRWHRDKLKNRNPYNPKVSVEVGIKVLKDCIDKSRNKRSALSCYSGGAKSYHLKVTKYQSEIKRFVSIEKKFSKLDNYAYLENKPSLTN